MAERVQVFLRLTISHVTKQACCSCSTYDLTIRFGCTHIIQPYSMVVQDIGLGVRTVTDWGPRLANLYLYKTCSLPPAFPHSGRLAIALPSPSKTVVWNVLYISNMEKQNFDAEILTPSFSNQVFIFEDYWHSTEGNFNAELGKK